MQHSFECQTRIDLTCQVEALRKRVEDLISEMRRNLNKRESLTDRRSLAFECQAITEHIQALERILEDHMQLHGCETVSTKRSARISLSDLEVA